MTKKIAFIGSAGTGKSTLATEVFTELKKKSLNAELVSEWIRYDIQANGPMESIWEQYRTLHHQRQMEDAVPDSVEWLVTDSGCLTPYFYSCLYAPKANERERLVLADMFKFLIDDIYKKRYTYVFFLPGKETYKTVQDDIVDDGTRYQSIDELKILDDHMSLVFTKMFNVGNIITLDCPLKDRIDKVMEIILKKA